MGVGPVGGYLVLTAPTPTGLAVSHTGGTKWGPNKCRSRHSTPHAWAAPPDLHLHAVLVDALLPKTTSRREAVRQPMMGPLASDVSRMTFSSRTLLCTVRLPEEMSQASWAGEQGLQAQVPRRDGMGRIRAMVLGKLERQIRPQGNTAGRQAGPPCLEAPGLSRLLPKVEA